MQYNFYSTQVTDQHLRNLVYCDFDNPMAERKMYVEVQALDKLAEVVEEYLAEYNSITKKPMNLVLFRYG